MSGKFKVIILGNCNVGKSCLFNAILTGEGTENSGLELKPSLDATFGVAYGQDVIIDLWDTSGSERFLSMTASYYRNADAVLLCYDVTNRTSLKRLRFWHQHLSGELGRNIPALIVGNKTDLSRGRNPLASAAVQMAAGLHAVGCLAVSAKTGDGVAQLIAELSKVLRDDVCAAAADEDGPMEELLLGDDPTDRNPASKRRCC